MSNLKGLMKMVKIPDVKNTSKSGPENGMNLKDMKKELEAKMNEKAKVYGFIGMEIYDLSKENKIEVPQIQSYLEKMDEINQTIEELENNVVYF